MVGCQLEHLLTVHGGTDCRGSADQADVFQKFNVVEAEYQFLYMHALSSRQSVSNQIHTNQDKSAHSKNAEKHTKMLLNLFGDLVLCI